MTALSPEQLYLFDTTGFLLIPGAFGADEVAAMRAELDRIAPVDSGFANTARFTDLPAASALFARTALDARLLGPVRDVVNQPLRLLEGYGLRRGPDSVLYLHGGNAELLDLDGGTVGRDMSITHTYHDGKLYCPYVKTLVYLSDITSREDGSFCYIQGSHKANFPLLRPRAERGARASLIDEGFPTLSDLYVRAGDLLLLNEALMHGTRRKRTPGDRLLVAYGYGPTFLTDWRELDGETGDLRGAGYVDHDVEEDFVHEAEEASSPDPVR
ncbi:phytanoyl-CoA dioxygenase family protein [Streptomyces sp. UNOC14_S4]|uniref:phytanoyl-CoA dioxygenase family protein n=1 Tax=Streptomyces sp. UNOC14_S4 TaxID=2872340 RepID=UPI001E2DDC3E|nr:phytanoyl-CoA dioxygenase family protein [Streptomyces sp. UNOC14_S4]MCC3766371.1 phytanoyl-CoA dioxygenase family protein [Streptomyces sp. UNOC14_S4]